MCVQNVFIQVLAAMQSYVKALMYNIKYVDYNKYACHVLLESLFSLFKNHVFLFTLLVFQAYEGRQVRCQCQQQMASSSLQMKERQMDKRTQLYDKATQTYWRTPSHPVSPNIANSNILLCRGVTVALNDKIKTLCGKKLM